MTNTAGHTGELNGSAIDVTDDAEELNCLIGDTVMAARRLQIGDIDMEGFVSFLKFHFPTDWAVAVTMFPDDYDPKAKEAEFMARIFNARTSKIPTEVS